MSKASRAAAVLWAALAVVAGMAWAGMARADSLSIQSGAGQSGLIGQPGVYPIVVQARNVNGVAVAGRTIHWSTSNGFQVSSATSVTDANGQASITFTYGNYGSTAISATDPIGNTSANAIENSVGTDSLVVISGSGQAGQQNTASLQPIVVELRNAAGAPISGRSIQWSDRTSYTQVNSASSLTNANGQASMGFTYLQGPPAVNGATATIRATNSVGAQSADATAIVVGFDLVQITSVQSTSGLVGTAGAPVTARVTDWSGTTPRAGVTVSWSERFNNPFVSFSAPTSVTDANGYATMNFQYVQPGNGEIEVTYGPSQTEVVYVSMGSERVTLVSPDSLPGTNGNTYTTIVEVRDSSNNPVVGRTLNWSVPVGNVVLAGPTSTTNASGQASMNYTCGVPAGDVISIVNPQAFNPAGADSYDFSERIDTSVCTSTINMTLISGTGQTGAVGSASAQPIVVEVRDAAGAPVAGQSINWGRNGPITLIGGATVTDAAGRASKSFTYTGAGQSMIQATAAGGSGTYLQAFVAGVGMPTIVPVSGDNQSGLPGSHSAQPLVLALKDATGAPIAGRTINWNINSPAGTGSFDAPTSVTDAAGQASMGFTYGPVAGVLGMEGDDSASAIRAGFHATTVGADGMSIISGNGQSGPQDTSSPQPLVVEIRDAAGAPVVGRQVNFNSIGDVTVHSPIGTTDGSGRASTTFDFGQGGANVAAIDSVTGKSVQFAMTGVEVPFVARIVSGDGQSGLPGSNGAQPIVVEVRNASNNPAPGENVAWSVVSGPATLLATTSTTDANGQVTATFNYGSTPGTSIIQAKDPSNPNGQLVQATVTSLGNNQSLVATDGADQVVVVGTPSLPLVVQLKDFANQPVVGATVNWTASNGSLQQASSTTDAQGNASNTVTPTAAGPVEVRASSQLAAADVVFTFNSSLAALPNLTPEEAATAVAIDNACPALAAKTSLTPQEADLLARCQELSSASTLDPNATSQALGELVSDTAQAQSTAAMTAVTAQVINVRTRLLALRSSSPTNSLSGLTFTAAGGTIALPSLLSALGDEKPPGTTDDVLNSPWGFFASGNIGRGEQKEGRAGPAFDYDIEGLTAGVDYRFNEDWVAGGALGYTHQDTDLDHDQGQVALQGWSLSFYGTHNFHKDWYVDGVVTTGRNQYKLERNIDYTVPLAGGGETHVQQKAVGKPDGDLLSAALTFGGDFHRQSFNFSPYGQLVYARIGFDAYTEDLHSGLGSGLGLSVDSRNVTGLTGILGARASWANSADWGVWTPTLMMEWNHEFHDELDGVTAHFTYDPTGTSIHVGGEPVDTDYLRFGFGLSFLLPHGRSGFFLYDRTFAQDRQLQENLSLGIRIEF